MLLTIYGTEWPILCWCAAKKLLTHSLTQCSWASAVQAGSDGSPKHQARFWPTTASQSPTSPVDNSLITVPRFRRCTFGRRAFAVRGAMPCNSPDNLRDPSLCSSCYRRGLRTVLLRGFSVLGATEMPRDIALYESNIDTDSMCPWFHSWVSRPVYSPPGATWRADGREAIARVVTDGASVSNRT